MIVVGVGLILFLSVYPLFPQFVQEGWVCPKCGRVFAPHVDMCKYCGGSLDYVGVDMGGDEDSKMYIVPGDISIRVTVGGDKDGEGQEAVGEE